MEFNKLKLTLENFAGSKSLLLISMKEIYAFVNGKYNQDKIEGYRCECIAPDNSYERIVIKVTNKPPVTQEVLSEGPVRITVDGFEGSVYKNYKDNSYVLSAKAKNVIILK